MKKLLTCLVVVLSLLLVSEMAMALATFGDGGAALQGVFDDITTAPVAGDSSIDVVNDALVDGVDDYWEITAAGSSVATMVIELASFAPQNILRVYDPANPSTTVDLFLGSSNPGDKVTLSIDLAGNVTVADPVSATLIDTGVFSGQFFGFQLDSSFYSTSGGGVWYSDTSLNADSMDHMYAYLGQGDTIAYPAVNPIWSGDWDENEYALAFEDLTMTVSDRDYTDMVVLVESVKPVPEPSIIFLLGSLLIGAGLIGRKRYM